MQREFTVRRVRITCSLTFPVERRDRCRYFTRVLGCSVHDATSTPNTMPALSRLSRLLRDRECSGWEAEHVVYDDGAHKPVPSRKRTLGGSLALTAAAEPAGISEPAGEAPTVARLTVSRNL